MSGHSNVAEVMRLDNNADTIFTEAVKLAPPVSVSTLTIMACPIADWVYVMTFMYTIVLIVCKIHSEFFRKHKE